MREIVCVRAVDSINAGTRVPPHSLTVINFCSGVALVDDKFVVQATSDALQTIANK